ncbi:MAG: energy transducer TonB [bacterium]
MRSKFMYLPVLLIIVFFAGCEKNACSNEDVFINPALVDQKASIITNDNEILKIVAAEFNENELYTKLGAGKHVFKISIDILKDGSCKQIGFMYSGSSGFETKKLLKEIDKFKKVYSSLKYQPAKVGDVNVNSFVTSHIKITFDDAGKITDNWAIVNTELRTTSEIDNKGGEYTASPEVMPELIGGMNELVKYIHYPELAKKAGIQGRVLVKVYIDETGNIIDTEILQSVGSGCDEAAMNAIKQVKFKPAMLKGKPVKCTVVIPIMFKLS